jgi:SAM-dependent methyltransferase
MAHNNFPNYQRLERNTKGQAGQANRSIPDRVDDYGIMNFIDKKSRVLDLGCNRGFFGTYLSPHIQSYVGCESDKNQLAHAQKKPNMEFVQGEFGCLNRKFDVILCLAFHSYVNISMDDFADCLDSMLDKGGTIFIEGHPPNYRGEPQQYFDPLMEKLLKKYKVIESKDVTDRELKRPFRILQRKK